MTTPNTDTGTPTTGRSDHRSKREPHDTNHRRPPWAVWAAVAAVIAVIAVVIIVIVANDDDDGAPTPEAAPLELDLGAGDSLASCLAFDVATLAQMSPAFAATATAVEGETVVLTVDRWYAGDPGTDAVELRAPSGLEALIGGIAFEEGEQYLITAAEGTVNYCGYSGVATPELTSAFEEAFAS